MSDEPKANFTAGETKILVSIMANLQGDLNADWAAVATDCGLKDATIARTRWNQIKRGKIRANSSSSSGNTSTATGKKTAAKTPAKAKAAPKPKASAKGKGKRKVMAATDSDDDDDDDDDDGEEMPVKKAKNAKTVAAEADVGGAAETAAGVKEERGEEEEKAGMKIKDEQSSADI